MAEEKILNITKLKITCNACNTQIITDLGNSIYSCPVCSQGFGVKSENDYFIRLKQVLQILKSNQAATFSLVCDTEE